MVVENSSKAELRFKNPGLLLLVVLGFVFWGVGFLDLLGHGSAEPTILGRYSLPFLIFIILYGCTIVIWFALFFNSNLLLRVAGLVEVIQGDIRLALAAFGGMGIAFWIIFEWDRWTRLPGLQFAALGLMMMAFLILLFANWNNRTDSQKWRPWIAYPLFALLALEVLIQVMAWLGVLPGVHRIGGNFYPYERIYYNGEGFFRNDFANRYGLYFPDHRLEDDRKRVLILGGSYIRAIPVEPEQQFSALLTNLTNQADTDPDGSFEFIPVGMPGFGLSPFLYEDVIAELPNLIEIDEIIIMVHLGDDFQSPTPSHNAVRYNVGESGKFVVHPEDARLRHDLTHYYLRSYLSFQIVETLRSNYLTPKVLGNIILGRDGMSGNDENPFGSTVVDFPRMVGFVTDTYDVTEPGHAGIKTTGTEVIPQGNNFIFAQGRRAESQEALLIFESILATAQEIALSKNIQIRLVTVPVFPRAFYDSYRSGSWKPQLGEYDLFLPERAIVDIATSHGIPVLPMGEYMLEDQLTVDEVRELYRPIEQGFFTQQGHGYYAEAIYTCFYSEPIHSACHR